MLVEIAPVVVYLRERTCQRVWRQNSSFSSLSHESFDFLLKISVEGNFCECDLYLWRLCSQQSYTGTSKQSEFDCLPTSSGRTCSMSFSVFAALAVRASRLHIYLAIWTDRAFLHMMGSKPWNMLSLGFGPNKDRFSA